jgi:hypothetical protein
MRIQNKYLRNKHFWNKSWNRARVVEQPYKTSCPYWRYGIVYAWSNEEQVKRHFEVITEQARRFVNGSSQVSFRNASASFRRVINAQRKAKESAAMQKIRNGQEDVEMPTFKNDAAWLYW